MGGRLAKRRRLLLWCDFARAFRGGLASATSPLGRGASGENVSFVDRSEEALIARCLKAGVIPKTFESKVRRFKMLARAFSRPFLNTTNITGPENTPAVPKMLCLYL